MVSVTDTTSNLLPNNELLASDPTDNRNCFDAVTTTDKADLGTTSCLILLYRPIQAAVLMLMVTWLTTIRGKIQVTGLLEALSHCGPAHTAEDRLMYDRSEDESNEEQRDIQNILALRWVRPWAMLNHNAISMELHRAVTKRDKTLLYVLPDSRDLSRPDQSLPTHEKVMNESNQHYQIMKKSQETSKCGPQCSSKVTQVKNMRNKDEGKFTNADLKLDEFRYEDNT
ncbi:hypothetical protein E2C01_001131 [Portunus trituberculatus]|uniref:Uncharacterized protein n=1 Tax=Portunus trituberculatus TaxID=210409 RepID=A0A5B7CLR3_PORTR|nr:hypothetical protein [Portunus trituberculatus]